MSRKKRLGAAVVVCSATWLGAATAQAQSPGCREVGGDAGDEAHAPRGGADPEERCGGDEAAPRRHPRRRGPRRPPERAQDEACDAPPLAVWGTYEEEAASTADACVDPDPPRRGPPPRADGAWCEPPEEPRGPHTDAEPPPADHLPPPQFSVHDEPLAEGLLYVAAPLLIGGTLGLIAGAAVVAKTDSDVCDANPTMPECDKSERAIGAAVLGTSSTAVLMGATLAALGAVEVPVIVPEHAGDALPAVAVGATGARATWAF